MLYEAEIKSTCRETRPRADFNERKKEWKKMIIKRERKWGENEFDGTYTCVGRMKEQGGVGNEKGANDGVFRGGFICYFC